MKIIHLKTTLILFVGFVAMISSCKHEPDPSDATDANADRIIHQSVNKQFVLIRNVDTLQSSDDEISQHIDSIINGYLNENFISTGYKSFVLNNDQSNDISFEIINLHDFNPNGLPESFDSLAARVIPITVQILDNSTYGYCDALNEYTPISSSGNWSTNTCVLGTFMNAGQFQGKGDKFLAFRLPNGENSMYGWLRINCSQHNDTLKIIDYGYNQTAGNGILAGQTE